MQNKNIPTGEPPKLFNEFEIHLKPIVVRIGAYITGEKEISDTIKHIINVRHKADITHYNPLNQG